MNIGKRIIEIRKNNNMSQEDFAELFNVTRQTISNWENLKSYPDIETLISISNKFNISLDTLLKEDNVLVKNINYKMNEPKKDDNEIKKFIILLGITIICMLTIIFDVRIYLPYPSKLFRGILIGVIIFALYNVIKSIIEQIKSKEKKSAKEFIYDIFTEEVEVDENK